MRIASIYSFYTLDVQNASSSFATYNVLAMLFAAVVLDRQGDTAVNLHITSQLLHTSWL